MEEGKKPGCFRGERDVCAEDPCSADESVRARCQWRRDGARSGLMLDPRGAAGHEGSTAAPHLRTS